MTSVYTECELRHMMEEGLEPSKAAEICAKAESPRRDEESAKSSDDDWHIYGD